MPKKKLFKVINEDVEEASITENISSVQLKISQSPTGAGRILAAELQRLAIMATEQGLGGPQWIEYMKYFASNQTQLDRLIGKDSKFNNVNYQKSSLSYIVANSTCGINTVTGTGRNLTQDQIDALDVDEKGDLINKKVEAGFEKNNVPGDTDPSGEIPSYI